MIEVIGVSFDDGNRIYYFDSNNIVAKVDDYIIVETERGLQYGKVLVSNIEKKEENLNLPLKKAIRLSNKEDKKKYLLNIEILVVFNKKIDIHKKETRMFDQNIKFKYTWRPYQEKVLRDVQKYISDGKVNIVAAPRIWKNYFGIRACKKSWKTSNDFSTNCYNKKSVDTKVYFIFYKFYRCSGVD